MPSTILAKPLVYSTTTHDQRFREPVTVEMRSLDKKGKISLNICIFPCFILTMAGSDYVFGDDGNWYKFHPERLTWHNAYDTCMREGAHLVMEKSARIHNYVKAEFVFKIGMWIGLSDEAKEDDFRWVDGMKPVETYWGDLQPNSQGGTNQDCMQTNFLGAGQWNDMDCDHKYPFLCQRIDNGKSN